MTISTDRAASGPYYPNGVTTEFPFDFDIGAASDLAVLVIGTDGEETVVSSSSYSVSISLTEPGGTVSFGLPPSALADGEEMWIALDPDFVQQDRYSDEGPFNQSLLEGTADNNARMSIWLRDRVLRSIRVPHGETGVQLPPRSQRGGLPGFFLGTDPDTGDLVFRDIGSGFQGNTGPANSSYSSRLAVAGAETSNLSAILADPDGMDAGVFTYDPAIPVAAHQDVGRKRRYVPPNIAIAGSWIKTDGLLRTRDLGLSPYNSGADNLAAWNVWRDEMQTLQERQEARPLLLRFDEDLFPFAGDDYIDIRQNHIRVDGRSAVIDGIGVRFSNSASINQQLYCRARDLVVRNAPLDCFNFIGSYYFAGDDLFAENAGRHGFSYSGGNNIYFKRPTAVGCSHYGFVAQRAMIPNVGGPGGFFETSLIALQIDDMDIRECGGGIALYECESARLKGHGSGTVQLIGATYNRGVSIERCRDVSVEGIHFEGNLIDIYVDTTHRVAEAWSNHAIRIRDNDCSSINSVTFGNADPISGVSIEGNRLAGNIQMGSASTGTSGVITADNVIQGAVALASGAMVDQRGLFAADGLHLAADQEVFIGLHRVLTERQPALGGLSGGTNADPECRAFALAIAAALQAHGLVFE